MMCVYCSNILNLHIVSGHVRHFLFFLIRKERGWIACFTLDALCDKNKRVRVNTHVLVCMSRMHQNVACVLCWCLKRVIRSALGRECLLYQGKAHERVLALVCVRERESVCVCAFGFMGEGSGFLFMRFPVIHSAVYMRRFTRKI